MREALGLLLPALMGLAAAAAAAWLVFGPAPPTPLNLILFLALLVPAAGGLLAPVLAALHTRIPFGGRPPSRRVALRQGLLIGLGLAFAAWLQLGRLLDGTLILAILALIVLAEVLIQSRAR